MSRVYLDFLLTKTEWEAAKRRGAAPLKDRAPLRLAHFSECAGEEFSKKMPIAEGVAPLLV